MKIELDKNGSVGLLSLGSYGLEVWEALKQNQPIPKEAPIQYPDKKRTIMIGWDSADWDMITPLIEQGKMPALKKLMENGSHGKIKTMEPSFSPMLWTSIATGKYAHKHGILGFAEVNSEGGVQPVKSTSRKCHALWNILESQNLKSNVIGWWPSHPAEPISGTMVTNQFHKIKHQKDGAIKWIEKNAVYPESLKETLNKFRIHTSDLTEAHLQPFVPELAKVNQEEDKSLSSLGDSIAQLATVQATTTWLMQNTDWDFTAVYFNDLDQICHKFGRFTSPKAEHIPQEQFNLYKDVVEGAYRLYDMMLDRLITLAGPNTNIVILSDHGFKLGEQKVKLLPNIPAAIALEHNPYGVLIMSGPDVQKQSPIFDAELLDITPTILQMLNLPMGKDMDGKILMSALKNQKILPEINSWETQEGNFGRHPKELQSDTIGAKQALEQLIELGYIEQLDDDAQEQLDTITRETKYNLSRVYFDQAKYKKCRELLEEIYGEDMVDIRFNTDLINVCIKLGDYERAHQVLSNFRKFDISKSVIFDQVEGKILTAEGKFKEAEKILLSVYNEKPQVLSLLADIGIVYNKQMKYDKAEKWLKRSITQFTKDPVLFHNLGIAQLRQEKYEEAIGPIVDALELRPTFAAAHYHLGECLYHLQDYQEAINALEACLTLNPGINRARNLLMNIYKSYEVDEAKYAEHKAIFSKTREEEIIVVTGLPRSGTSMLMKMLYDGGIDVYQDNIRAADDSNPKGYFEVEAVKNSRKDVSWLENAKGKAVKVVTPLLTALKLKYSFKVIWIDRKISEVMMSQEEMLSRSDPSRKGALNLAVQKQYLKMNAEAEQFLDDKNNVEVLKLKHEEVLESPLEAANKIYEFLGGRGDVQKMANAVDKDLHRVKIENEEFSI